MMIREYLRYIILGSPFLLPDIKDLIPLLKYEITNNVRFMIFIFMIVMFNLFLIYLLMTYRSNINLVLAYGFLLIECSLILHKLKVVEFINSRNQENQNSSYIAQLFGIGNERKKNINLESESKDITNSLYIENNSQRDNSNNQKIRENSQRNNSNNQKIIENNLEIKMSSSSLQDSHKENIPKLGFLEGFTSVSLY